MKVEQLFHIQDEKPSNKSASSLALWIKLTLFEKLFHSIFI